MSNSNKPHYLMIDNGAAISIVNESLIDPDQLIVIDEKCLIKGVTQGEVETLGSTSTIIDFGDDVKVQHTFQIVSSNFPLQVDGIIGRDFLKKMKANIDYSTYSNLITVTLERQSHFMIK